MTYNIAVVAGDGIGPEIIDAGIKVAETVAPGRFQFNHVVAGGKSIDEFGVPLTDETLAVCRQSDSVLLGAVGGPKWDRLPGHLRPERACARNWACSPTSGPPGSSRSSRTPAPSAPKPPPRVSTSSSSGN